MVQELATEWIQSYPCKTKTSQETERSSQKFLEPTDTPNVIFTDSSLEFGKSCKDLSCNLRTSARHRSDAERAIRRIKEVTSAGLLQSGLDENWWADSMECYYLQLRCFVPEAELLNDLQYLRKAGSVGLRNLLSIVSWSIAMEDQSCSSGRFSTAHYAHVPPGSPKHDGERSHSSRRVPGPNHLHVDAQRLRLGPERQ